jgi:hypothetical protein
MHTSKLPPNPKIRIIAILDQFRDKAARDIEGNGEVSLLEPAILSLYHGQHYLQSLTIAMKITSDITNKRAESTLNGSPA